MKTPGLLSAAVLAALLSGCDGGSGPDPVPSTPPPPAPVTTVIAEGSFSGLEPNGAVVATFTTPRAGNLEVVLDWTFASNDLDFILTRGECQPEQLIALECDIAAIAESTTAKPERAGVANAPAGPYTLFIGNFGATEDSISFQVLLTTTSAASERTVRSSAVQASVPRVLQKGAVKTFVRLP